MDRVRPFKLETPAAGGTQTDLDWTEVDPGQDAIDCAGVHLQEPGSITSTSDAKVYTDRLAGSMRFTDNLNGTLALRQLITTVSGKPGSHNNINDIIHWLGDGGPGDGYASGATFVTFVTGAVVTREAWYTSATQKTLIYDVVYTYQGLLVLTATRTLYVAGVKARQVVDSYTYPTVFAPQVTRTWS